MSAPLLRPLRVGEVLDAAIKITLRRFKHLAIATAVLVGPVLIVSALVQQGSADPAQVFTTPEVGGPPVVDTEKLKSLLAALAVSLLLSFIGSTLAAAATLKIASGAYLNEAPDWKASVRLCLSQFMPLLWLSLLTTIITVGVPMLVIGVAALNLSGGLGAVAALAILAAAAAAVWLYVGFVVAIPVFFLENKRGMAALNRSRELVRNCWWQTLWVQVLISLIAALIGGALTVVFLIPASLIGKGPAASLLQVIGTLVASIATTPLAAAATLVRYVDLRVRKEGYDLQVLADHLGVTAPSEWNSPPAPNPGYPSFPPPTYPAPEALAPPPAPSVEAPLPWEGPKPERLDRPDGPLWWQTPPTPTQRDDPNPS